MRTCFGLAEKPENVVNQLAMSDSKQASEESVQERITLSGINDLSLPVRAMGFGALGVLVLIYFVYPAYPSFVHKTLATWTWGACNPISNFLHGRFVPLAFGVMIWMAYQGTKKMGAQPSYAGLPLLLLGLFFFLISMRTIQPRLALIGAPFVVIGFTYYLFGFQIAKHIIFPSFFLWFSVPVPGLEAILTGNLQVLITKACYHTGIFFGMDLVNTGADIYIGGSSVKVAEGCSGIRSLMALTMIAAVYANYTQKPLWKKAFLFVLALPLAIAGNFLRIFTILVLAQFGYADFGTGTWHDWAGLLIFFPIALSGLYLADYLLNFKEKRSKRVKRTVKKSPKVVKEKARS